MLWQSSLFCFFLQCNKMEKKKKVGVTRARVGKSTFSPIGFGQACKIF